MKKGSYKKKKKINTVEPLIKRATIISMILQIKPLLSGHLYHIRRPRPPFCRPDEHSSTVFNPI